MKQVKKFFTLMAVIAISMTAAGGYGVSAAAQQTPEMFAAAHNSYSGDTPDSAWNDSLDRHFYNLELDFYPDSAHSRYTSPGYLNGKVKLFVRHLPVSDPGTLDISAYFDDLRQRFNSNNGSIYGDGKNLILTLQPTAYNNADAGEAAETLNAILEHHQSMLSTGVIGNNSSFAEGAVTVVFTGWSGPAEEYFQVRNNSNRILRAFRDTEIGDTYLENVDDYFTGIPDADIFFRFLTAPWNVVENGYPLAEGNFSQEEEERLERILQLSTQKGFRIRFYSLNGAEGPIYYRFLRGYGAAGQRWSQFAKANENLLLKHFVASDDRQEIMGLFNNFIVPWRYMNDGVKNAEGGHQSGTRPGVAIAAGRRVIEVHKSPYSYGLWYTTGTAGSDYKITWNYHSSMNKSGVTPDLTVTRINGVDAVVQVNKSETTSNLWYNFGRLNADGSISWYTNDKISLGFLQDKKGVDPRAASSGNRIVQVNKSEGNGGLWYNSGVIDTGGNKVVWKANNTINNQNGSTPDISIRSDNKVIAVYTDASGKAAYSLGTLNADCTISWQASSTIAGQEGNNPTVAFLGGNKVIEMHNAPVTGEIFFNTGILEGNTIRWLQNFMWDSGVCDAPSLEYDANENLLVDIHKAGGVSDKLWYNAGRINNP